MRSGAVSPPTRAIPSNAPVITALLEEGSTTRRIARYRGIPRASADSRVEMGTRRRASSEVRATNGIMIVDKAMTPVAVLKTSRLSTTPAAPSSRMRENAKMPTTMDGIWVMTSTKNRTAAPTRFFPYSAR